MDKYIRATNKDETHCCSLKDIKVFFGNTEISVSFDYGKRKFDAKTYRIEKYIQKNVKGLVICALDMSTRCANSWLLCYVIKKNEYSEEMRKKFVSEYLLKLYEYYKENLNDQSIIRRENLVLVELYNGQFNFHKVTTDREVSDVK